MKLHKDQSGFGHLETAIVVVIIATIGVIGWLVYDRQKAQQNTPNISKQITSFDECAAAGNPIMESYPEQCSANGKTFTKNVSISDNNSNVKTVDETLDWQSYTSRSGKYSVKYPKTWVVAANLEYCTEGLTLIGVTINARESSVGKCASGGPGAFGQIAISEVSNGSDTSACGLDSQQWQTDSKKSVTVDGLSATRTVGTYIASDQEFGGYEKGASTVKYCFTTKNTVYTASYIKRDRYPDVLNDFDTMATKTLTLNQTLATIYG